MNEHEEEISVQFSGGSDSTYVAAQMAKRFNVVHLHTYSHMGIFFEKKCEKNLSQLHKAFGSKKFTHRYVSVNKLFKAIYLKNMVCDFHKYGNYLISCSCAACKLAMHMETIIYNMKRGIRYACDGSQRESGTLFPEQMPGVLDAIADLYSSFGITFTNPAYDTERTDWRLYEMGITPKRDYKNEHVFYSVQHSCIIGTLLYVYVLGFYYPFFGRQADEVSAVKYIRDKIEGYRNWVEEQVEETRQPSIKITKAVEQSLCKEE